MSERQYLIIWVLSLLAAHLMAFTGQYLTGLFLASICGWALARWHSLWSGEDE